MSTTCWRRSAAKPRESLSPTSATHQRPGRVRRRRRGRSRSDVAVAAYNGQAGNLRKGSLQAAATIIKIGRSRHAAWARSSSVRPPAARRRRRTADRRGGDGEGSTRPASSRRNSDDAARLHRSPLDDLDRDGALRECRRRSGADVSGRLSHDRGGRVAAAAALVRAPAASAALAKSDVAILNYAPHARVPPGRLLHGVGAEGRPLRARGTSDPGGRGGRARAREGPPGRPREAGREASVLRLPRSHRGSRSLHAHRSGVRGSRHGRLQGAGTQDQVAGRARGGGRHPLGGGAPRGVDSLHRGGAPAAEPFDEAKSVKETLQLVRATRFSWRGPARARKGAAFHRMRRPRTRRFLLSATVATVAAGASCAALAATGGRGAPGVSLGATTGAPGQALAPPAAPAFRVQQPRPLQTSRFESTWAP